MLFAGLRVAAFTAENKGTPEAYRIAHTVIKIGCRSGDGAVGQSCPSALFDHGLPAQLIFAVRHSRGAHGVADENDSVVSEQAENAADYAGMKVDAVADNLHHHIFVVCSGSYDARLSVKERRHGVKKMGGVAGSLLKGSCGSVVGGRGVPQRYGCLILQLCDKFIRSGKLRGNGYQPDSAACSSFRRRNMATSGFRR